MIDWEPNNEGVCGEPNKWWDGCWDIATGEINEYEIGCLKYAVITGTGDGSGTFPI